MKYQKLIVAIFLAATAFSVQAQNIIKTQAPIRLELTPRPPIQPSHPAQPWAINEASLPPVTRLNAYSYELAQRVIQGADTVVSWNPVSIPQGLTLKQNGRLEGHPTESGTQKVVVDIYRTVSGQKRASFDLFVDKIRECTTYTTVQQNNLAQYGHKNDTFEAPQDPYYGTRISWAGTLIYSDLTPVLKPKQDRFPIGQYVYYKGSGVTSIRQTTFEGTTYRAYDHELCREEL